MEEKVEIDLRKMAGKPVIKGTRVTIESVLKAALEYAAKIVEMEEVLPFKTALVLLSS